MTKPILTAIALTLAVAAPAHAGLGGRAAGELAEFLMKKFGKEAAREGAEKLAGRLVKATARHGDDVLTAVRKVGPKAINLADDAGANAPSVLRLLNHYGDDAARVLSRPQGMALIGRYGDDAASALIKHQGIAEPLVESMGRPAVQALGAIGARSGRRLAIMAEGGELATLGRTPEVLGIISKYGDPAMEFLWRNKGTLAVGTALTAFLANPQPFIDGTIQLSDSLIEGGSKAVESVAAHVVKPVVIELSREAARTVPWGTLSIVSALVLGVVVSLRVLLRRPVRATTASDGVPGPKRGR